MASQQKNRKGDSCFYGDWDEKSMIYGVFGDHSSFCYATFATQIQADTHAIKMDKEVGDST
jgi:hypothetical protein